MSDPTPDPDRARAFADLSHELRGLAGAALMSAQSLALSRSEDDRAKATASLNGATRRLVRLADDLRDVADLLGARRPGDRVEHDVVYAARRLCAELAPDAVLHKTELVLEADGIPAHVLVGDPLAWDRTLVRLLLAGIEGGRRAGRIVARFEPRDGTLALVVPCGHAELPPAGEVFTAWAEARRGGSRVFAMGLWLARAFLEAEGGHLAVREEADGRRLVATFPAARPERPA